MKFLLSLFLACFSLQSAAISGGSETGSNPLVKTAVVIAPRSVRAGGTAEVRVTLTPNPGIHIVIQPPVDLTLDSTAAVASVAKPDIPVAKDGEHLDPSRPVRLNVTLARSLKPGTVTLKGTLVYYYCSDEEGTCNRFRQPLDLKIRIAR